MFSKADYIAHNRSLEDSSLEPMLGSMKPGEQIICKRNPDYLGINHPLNIGTETPSRFAA